MPTAPSVERVRTKTFVPFFSISTEAILTGEVNWPGRLNIGCSAARTSGAAPAAGGAEAATGAGGASAAA